MCPGSFAGGASGTGQGRAGATGACVAATPSPVTRVCAASVGQAPGDSVSGAQSTCASSQRSAETVAGADVGVRILECTRSPAAAAARRVCVAGRVRSGTGQLHGPVEVMSRGVWTVWRLLSAASCSLHVGSAPLGG
ncbi:MAG: hypothetical protein WDW38_002976 [Sanguina aurantia]